MSLIKSSIYANDSLGKSFMQNISFQLSDMLLSCTYNGYKCDSSNFIQFTTYDRGNCYMFNSNTSNIEMSTQFGQFFGLQLELFVGLDGIYKMEATVNSRYSKASEFETVLVPYPCVFRGTVLTI